VKASDQRRIDDMHGAWSLDDPIKWLEKQGPEEAVKSVDGFAKRYDEIERREAVVESMDAVRSQVAARLAQVAPAAIKARRSELVNAVKESNALASLAIDRDPEVFQQRKELEGVEAELKALKDKGADEGEVNDELTAAAEAIKARIAARIKSLQDAVALDATRPWTGRPRATPRRSAGS